MQTALRNTNGLQKKHGHIGYQLSEASNGCLLATQEPMDAYVQYPKIACSDSEIMAYADMDMTSK